MTEPKTDVQEEEYQFDDFDKFDMPNESAANPAEGVSSVQGAESVVENFAPRKDYRKMAMIGLVVVIILGFVIYGLLGRSTSVKIPKESSVLPQVNSPQPTPMTTQAQNPAQVPAAVIPPPVPMATEKDIDQLTSTVTAQQQNMDQMQNSINTLQESVGTLNATIGDLSQKLSDALSKMPEKRVAPRPIAKPIAAEPPRPTYTIRAMVPGRAWLQASDGQTMTVVNGDQVPAYGSVQDIDLNAGQVVLSDGTIIGYNYNS